MRSPAVKTSERHIGGPSWVCALALLGGILGASGAATAQPMTKAQPGLEATIITLTQTGCQFLESEAGVDHGFKTKAKPDCEKINDKTSVERLKKVAPLTVKPGKYIFRVTNKNVPYELGFWLRGAGLARLIQPNVSGGGLTEGVTRDYSVELTAGEYAYSCPLNPTPDYPLIVKD